jgi:hypothetical protein
MAGDQYEPNRFLGLPQPKNPKTGRKAEPQRVMGFPVDLYGLLDNIDLDFTWALMHPVRGYRRWLRRRRLGPYATDEDGPRARRWGCGPGGVRGQVGMDYDPPGN